MAIDNSLLGKVAAIGRRPVDASPKAGHKSFGNAALMRLLGTYGTIIVLVAMLVVFSLLAPRTFATFGNLRNILNDMAIGTIVAAGLTVPLVAGDFDLSIGYVASFCGLLLVGILSAGQLPMALAILIVICIGTLIGIVNGIIVSKIGVNAFIATLGTGTVVVGLNYAYSGGVPLQLTRSREFTDIAIGRFWGVPHLVLIMAANSHRAVDHPQPNCAGTAHPRHWGQRQIRTPRRRRHRPQPNRSVRHRQHLRCDRRRPDGIQPRVRPGDCGRQLHAHLLLRSLPRLGRIARRRISHPWHAHRRAHRGGRQ